MRLGRRTGVRSTFTAVMLVLTLVMALAPVVALACHITGYKFLDLNGNGIRDRYDSNGDGVINTADALEPGLGGWTITLQKWNGSTWVADGSYTTLGDGSYSISVSTNTHYRIKEQPPEGESGWVQSAPVVGQPGDWYEFTTPGSGDPTPINFGNLKPGSLRIDKRWLVGDTEVTPPGTAEICISRGGVPQSLPVYQTDGVTEIPWTDGFGYCQLVGDEATWKNLWPGTYDIVEKSVPGGWQAQSNIPDAVVTSGLNSVTVITFWPGGTLTQYKVVLDSHVGNSWTYTVTEITGKSLSHFVIGLGGCILQGDINTELTTPDWQWVNPDPTTGVRGIKWNTDSAPTSFTFTLALNRDFVAGPVPVAGKGGTKFSIAYIAGPSCMAVSTPPVVTNTAIPGSLEVTKYWVGGTAEGVQICITGADYPKNCQDAPANGQTVSWDNLVPGTYTVTEEGINLTEWIVEITPGSVTVPADDTGTATVTNTRKGSLTVTKTVVLGDLVGQPSETFEICIAGPSYPQGNEQGACKTIDIAGGTLTWDNLIPGLYTVTETNPGAEWVVSYNVLAGGPDLTASAVQAGVQVAVPAGGEGAVEVTNTYRPGSLKVTKAVDWNGATPVEGQTFEICITGPSYDTPNCKIVAVSFNEATQAWEGTAEWLNLLPGNYVVTESDPGPQWAVASSGVTVSVPIADQGTHTVTNTLKRGSLQVTKTVNWNGVTPATDQTFTICIQGPSYPNGNEEGACQTIAYNGGTLTWNDLTPGDYIVTEIALGTEWMVPVISGSPATVVANGTASASVTNTRKLGSLIVTKTVNWNGVAADPAQTFQICITGPTYPTGKCQTADFDGATLTWTGLIPGAYTVTETGQGSQWTVEVTGSPATVPADGGQASASVTNTYNLGSLLVTKIADWGQWDAVAEQVFEICISGPSFSTPNCKQLQQSALTPVTGTTTYTGTLLWDNLLPGPYTVTETTPAGRHGQIWTVDVPAGPVTVTAGQQAQAQVTNTLPPPSPPTAVELREWTVTASGNSVTHAWSTAWEQGTQSFRLYRGSADLAAATLVYEVAAQGTASAGHTYGFSESLAAGSHYYWLVEQTTAGQEVLVAGPKSVVIGTVAEAAKFRVFLPITLR